MQVAQVSLSSLADTRLPPEGEATEGAARQFVGEDAEPLTEGAWRDAMDRCAVGYLTAWAEGDRERAGRFLALQARLSEKHPGGSACN